MRAANASQQVVVSPDVVEREEFFRPERKSDDARVCCDGLPQHGCCNKTVDHTFLVTDLVPDHRPAIAESDLGPTRADRR
jgi:hypothetical protein